MLSPSLYDPDSKVVNFKINEDMENIRFKLAGTNLLYNDPEFIYSMGKKGTGIMEAVEWRRPKEICKSPKFIDCKPCRFDALQGQLGDCWVISAMEALTLHSTLIKHVVPPDQSFNENYIGAFHFRIWNLGVWYDVVVDDRLPVYKKSKKLCYCTSRTGEVFWAALLEKAYAKFWVTDKVSYDVISTGNITTALINFTGGIEEVICVNPHFQEKFGYLPPGTTLKSLLYEGHKRNALMCCLCLDKSVEWSSDLGVVPSHQYTITYVCKSADDDPEFSHDGVGLFLVRILNPWGHHEFTENWSHDDRYGGPWKNFLRKVQDTIFDFKDDTVDDGEFWMNDENLTKYFTFVYICHLGPGQFVDTRNVGLNWTTWKTTFFRGEWVTGVSAAGSNPKYRHKLPRYGIELRCPENAVNDQRMCYVVIHLTHRAKYRRYKNCPPTKHCKKNSVGFYIYDTTLDVKSKNESLENEFFEINEPINSEPNWKAGSGRSYVLGMFMGCGRYCIVPCSHYADMDSQFLLRVFSTNDVDDWEFDKTISKKASIAEENPCYSENDIHNLFNDIALDQNEIDWRELKYIFDAVFNPKPPYFKIFITIKNYIHHVLGIFPSMRSYYGFKDEHVDFTKDQCRSMIAMMDHNHSGKLDFSEFRQLWNKINFWIKVYNQHRDDTMGLLQVGRLTDALGAIGYDINTRAVHSLSYVFADDEAMILLTDFVLCGVALETALSCFEEETFKSGNKLTLTLEEWVKSTLIL